jgi:cell wall-associated NlpC family hydrolase
MAVASLLASLTLVVALPSGAAQASPDPQAQIDALWDQLEPLIEQYNGVHTKLLADQAKAAELQKQLDPLVTQVDLASSRVGAISAQLYMQGPLAGMNAMLSGGPTEAVDRLGSLNALAHGQQVTIENVAGLVKNYQDQKKPLDELIAQEKAMDADLAARKAQIQGLVAALQKLISNSAVNIAVLKPTSCPVVPGSGKGQTAVSFACSQIGKPYKWGEDGPSGYDCSGLTKASWAKAGVTLAHYTYDQWTHVKRVSSPAVGDLVFYFSDVHHVAIYAGGGWVVHAPHPGDHVRMAKMASIGTVKGYGHPG